jgi:hypothetical protein
MSHVLAVAFSVNLYMRLKRLPSRKRALAAILGGQFRLLSCDLMQLRLLETVRND